jgi:AraC-like DNA-binding protein
MSCKQDLLLDEVMHRLSLAPSTLLERLAQEFDVSRRTLHNAISMITGKTFRELRDEQLVERLNSLLESHPTRGIKELSFELGFKSPRSFARAIKRACGFSPSELRSRIIFQLIQDKK